MKRFLFIFALVVSLVLPGAENVYAAEVSKIDALNYWLEQNGLPVLETDYVETENTQINVIFTENIGNGRSIYYIRFFEAPTNFKAFLTPIYTNDHRIDFLNTDSSDVITEFKVTRYNFEYHTSTSSFTDIQNDLTNYDTYLDFFVGYSVVYSSFDIYTDNTFSELFFPKTPLPPMPILPVIIQEVEMNPLKEILILLPMVTVCWVGYVALRKALRTLETILKRA